MTCGDNYNSVHKMKDLHDGVGIIVAYCEKCKFRTYIRKDNGGRPDPKFRIIFKRELLQPGTNLYYKEYPHKMNVITS